MLTIGSYKISTLSAGSFKLDGGAMFGVIPKIMWEKKEPPDDKNRIQMVANILILSDERRKILIDTGIGDKWDEKFAIIYAIDRNRADLITSLNQHNLAPEDITDVILTHLHFDHAGGSTFFDNNKLVPTFPNARHYIQKKHWQWAQDPSERDRASFMTENFIPLKENGLIEIVEGSFELLPNIHLIEINGHTPAQQLIRVTDGEKTLFHCGDLIPMAAHVPIPWVMSYDLYPLTTMQEKHKYLARAVHENWLLFFEHDLNVVIGSVKRTPKGFDLDRVYSSKD